VPAKVVALIMGHTKVDTDECLHAGTRRRGARRCRSGRIRMFRIVQKPIYVSYFLFLFVPFVVCRDEARVTHVLYALR
jgi:hypothetical protein